MQAPPQLLDEADRLAALRALELLDTGAEERFDRLARIARAVFDAPIALLTLVDAERQWFKAARNFDFEMSEQDWPEEALDHLMDQIGPRKTIVVGRFDVAPWHHE